MTDESAKGRPRRIGPVFFIIVGLALAVLIALGNWQIRRLHWKQDLLASIDQRIRSDAIDLEAAMVLWERTSDVDYLPVRLEGVFRHADEHRYLATHNGQSGWYLYTPLERPDGSVVIVNRGFVPYAFADPEERPWEPVSGRQTLKGLARDPLTVKPGWVVPDNAPEDRVWYWKDHAAMASAMGLSGVSVVPFFVDLSADGVAVRGPVAGVTRIDLPNNHLQYAVTWFGLAVVLVITAALVVWRNRRAGRSEN